MSSAPVALYYPHTRVQAGSLLKTALLLWDHVDVIIPNNHRSVEAPPRRSRELLEAEDLLVRYKAPSSDEKARVHKRIKELLANGVPAWMHEELKGADSRHFLVYPEKLAHETWRLLESADLAQLIGKGGRDYRVPPALGLLLMATLADECAGYTRTKVTDRQKAYSWLMGVMTHSLGGEYSTDLKSPQLADNYDRLITTSIQIANVRSIPVKRLLEMRKREAAGKSNDYRKFRRRYVERIESYVKRMCDVGNRPSDLVEIQRQYRLDMEGDLRELKRELTSAARDVLLSQEMLVTVVAVAGATALPATGVFGVGALVRAEFKYREARRTILEKHPMSWLHLSERQRFSVV